MVRTNDYYEMRIHLLSNRNATENARIITKCERKIRKNATKEAFTDFVAVAAE